MTHVLISSVSPKTTCVAATDIERYYHRYLRVGLGEDTSKEGREMEQKEGSRGTGGVPSDRPQFEISKD